mmetsp:Transcript_14922/g.24688  ORF Transcript_14922/g.24688 Transcript_14922/m.24688 type:complete len:334 (-) Transcript_14922:67-1068(-)
MPPSNPLVFHDNRFELSDELGEGHFGSVHRARRNKDDKYFAVKVLSKMLMGKEDKKEVEKEASIVKGINHRNITQIYPSYQDSGYFYLVMELCEGKKLADWINGSKKQRTEENIMACLYQICQGMNHLNNKDIVHLDLHLSNICVKEKKAKEARDATLKLLDFGLAKKVKRGEDSVSLSFGQVAFRPPEALDHEGGLFPTENLKKADVWSVGIMTFEMFYGANPFRLQDVDADIEELIKKGKFSFPKAPKIGKKAKAFIRRCLTYDAGERPTFDDLLKDEWFSEVPSCLVEASKSEYEKQLEPLSGLMVGMVDEILKKKVKKPKQKKNAKPKL